MKPILFTALAALLPACAAAAVDDPGADDPAGDSGTDTGDRTDPPAQSPRFEVLLTDAPGDFDEVWVDIASVEIESEADGWIQLTEEPQSFDLLTLQNDVTAALGDADLAPGHYGQLRLIVADASVVSGGASEDLTIASGAQTGIKINLDSDVEDGMAYTLVLDFDAGKSIKATGKGWLMTPVVQVKDFAAVPVPPADDGAGADGAGDTGDTGGTGDAPTDGGDAGNTGDAPTGDGPVS